MGQCGYLVVGMRFDRYSMYWKLRTVDFSGTQDRFRRLAARLLDLQFSRLDSAVCKTVSCRCTWPFSLAFLAFSCRPVFHPKRLEGHRPIFTSSSIDPDRG